MNNGSQPQKRPRTEEQSPKIGSKIQPIKNNFNTPKRTITNNAVRSPKTQKTENSASPFRNNDFPNVTRIGEKVDKHLDDIMEDLPKNNLFTVQLIKVDFDTKSLRKFLRLPTLFGVTFHECSFDSETLQLLKSELIQQRHIDSILIQKDSVDKHAPSIFKSHHFVCEKTHKDFYFIKRNQQPSNTPQRPNSKLLKPKKLVLDPTNSSSGVEGTLVTIKIPQNIFKEKAAPRIREESEENRTMENGIREFIRHELKAKGIESIAEESAETASGFHIGDIDISTANEIIEVKEHKLWKHALGQIISYGSAPAHKSKEKLIVLFSKKQESTNEISLDEIQQLCQPHNVKVLFIAWAQKSKQ